MDYLDELRTQLRIKDLQRMLRELADEMEEMDPDQVGEGTYIEFRDELLDWLELFKS